MNDIIEKCSYASTKHYNFVPINLKVEKKILNEIIDLSLLVVFECDYKNKKKYIRSFAITISGNFITKNVNQSELFLTELMMFEKGDANNIYLKPVYKDSLCSLKELTYKNTYITKSIAKDVMNSFNKYIRHYTMNYAYEHEVELTAAGFSHFLNKHNESEDQYTKEEEKSWFKELVNRYV